MISCRDHTGPAPTSTLCILRLKCLLSEQSMFLNKTVKTPVMEVGSIQASSANSQHHQWSRSGLSSSSVVTLGPRLGFHDQKAP